MPLSTFSDARLGADGDLPEFTSLISGVDALAQRLLMRLQTHLGEWFADPTVGLPWRQWAGLRPLPPGLVRARVRAVVESLPGVTAVRDVVVTADDDTRSMDIDIDVVYEREVVNLGYRVGTVGRRGNVSVFIRSRALFQATSPIHVS